MGSLSPSASINAPLGASNSDEYFLQHSLRFAESLKDLKNIRVQLHSAAEYFESSYMKHEHKQLVEETLKDYITKALISTVDHLGSVACKVNSFLDDKGNEISSATLRFSSIEQRVRTFGEVIGRCGLSQQSLIIETPKHYKRYSIPVSDGQIMSKIRSIPNGCILSPQDDMHQNKQPDNSFSEAFRGNVTKPHPPLSRRGNSRLHSTEPPTRPLTFSFMRLASSKEGGKRAVSPLSFPLGRSGSVANNRSISPGSCSNRKQCPSELRRTSTMFMNPERSKGKEMELYPRKSKYFFKALLSIHRSRKEGVPHRFRDDY